MYSNKLTVMYTYPASNPSGIQTFPGLHTPVLEGSLSHGLHER